MMRRRGFTMIELMTAIGIGMFILYVAFAGFRAASSAMQSSQRLSIGNAMLRACVYYSFNRADGISANDMPDGPSAYPDSWPTPTVRARFSPRALLESCSTVGPSRNRATAVPNVNTLNDVFIGDWHTQWGTPRDYFRLTPYGRDDPNAAMVKLTFEGLSYDVAYVNDGRAFSTWTPSVAGFNTSHGRRLTTSRRRESDVQLVDALTGRTTRLRFRVTTATHKAADTISESWGPEMKKGD